jgi:hypothetical protein
MKVNVKCGKIIDNGIESMICAGEITLDDNAGSKYLPHELESYLANFYEEHCHCKVSDQYPDDETEAPEQPQERVNPRGEVVGPRPGLDEGRI